MIAAAAGLRTLLALTLVGSSFPEQGREAEVLSPRLRELYQSLANGEIDAIGTFWQVVADSGTPLIEEIATDPDHQMVTFLWRDSEKAAPPLLVSGHTNWNRTAFRQLHDSDVWYQTFRIRNDARFVYTLIASDDPEGVSFVDPLNPRTVPWPEPESLVELPEARPQLWIDPQPGVLKGRTTTHAFRSEVLDNERNVWVYVPSGFDAAREALPLVVFLDGWLYLEYIPTPAILDNMIAAGEIEPLVAAFIDTREARMLELGCYRPFNEFLVDEFVPWMRTNFNIDRGPDKTVIAGLSRGGLAAAFAALEHPEVFGNVLSQSGAYWYKPPWERGQEEIWQTNDEEVGFGWLISQYTSSPPLPLRFYLDVGRFESDGSPSLLYTNRHMRDILLAKGYAVEYQEFSGGHSSINWRGTLSDGLASLLRRE